MRRWVMTGMMVFLGVSALAATEPPSNPIVVTNYGKKAAVTFDHAKHGDLDCAACHHQAGTGTYLCGECHGVDAQGEAVSIKDAMHNKDGGVCYRCHFGKEAEAKKLKCSDCHSE